MPEFHFELVSPERHVFAGDVESVVVPGSEGQFTVLKDHAPFMTTLRPGVVDIGAGAAGRQRYFVRGGFADVSPAGLTILAERAVPLDELDAAKLDQDIKDAEDDIADATAESARQAASERRDQLVELKIALKI
ncbi:F0F1 ATP synthase subunit epsilon [Methylocella sp.]|uniref:F0F1 ATP synthase subunit epsilon n=1 Tax=Methylocella sp. TaxID=1978226 RepID=UPI0037842C01